MLNIKDRIKEIFIGGSKDKLYPVWWSFPTAAGSKKIGRITISRYYAWNEDTRPLDPNRPHQASLMLDIEGWACGWAGDPHIMNILNYGGLYNGTVSHL